MKLGGLRTRASVVVILAVAGLALAAAPAPAAIRGAAAVAPEVSLVAGINDPKDPNIAVLEFLPAKVTVAKGTTVTWTIAGPEPHSVTFVAPGASVPPSIETDPALTFPTAATGPYDGSSLVSSGVQPLVATSEAQKFSMSFGKKGTYTYYCVLHPNMVGTVVVTDGRQDPQSKITKAGYAEKGRYLREGEAAKAKLASARPRSTKASDGTTTHTVEMGASTPHTDVLAFLPTPRDVKPGDRVTFVNDSATPHTASFGGPLVPTVQTAPDVVNAVPGPSPQALAPATYLNTGWLPPRSKQGPPVSARSYTYAVPTAGKWTYACVLHLPSGMAGEIEAG